MKLKEVITLLKAGYTKEEIAEFKALESKEEPQADPEPPAEDSVPDITALADQVSNLTNMLQEHFRATAEGKKTDQATGEQVLKDILEKGVI